MPDTLDPTPAIPEAAAPTPDLSDRDPATGMRMGEKLRTYFLGVGLGLVMVAMMFAARAASKRQQPGATVPPGATTPGPSGTSAAGTGAAGR